jgi:hypothetical protein
MHLWVPGHTGVQDNEDADGLVTKGMSDLFLSPEPAIPILPCVGMLKVHPEYWAATLGMRHFKLKDL